MGLSLTTGAGAAAPAACYFELTLSGYGHSTGGDTMVYSGRFIATPFRLPSGVERVTVQVLTPASVTALGDDAWSVVPSAASVGGDGILIEIGAGTKTELGDYELVVDTRRVGRGCSVPRVEPLTAAVTTLRTGYAKRNRGELPPDTIKVRAVRQPHLNGDTPLKPDNQQMASFDKAGKAIMSIAAEGGHGERVQIKAGSEFSVYRNHSCEFPHTTMHRSMVRTLPNKQDNGMHSHTCLPLILCPN